MKEIAVFASGSGTNFQAIVDYFRNHKMIKVGTLFCNSPDAGAVRRAEKAGIPVVLFTKEDLYGSNKVLNILLEKRIDLIVLAGFMWLIPPKIVSRFRGRIVNIHPALLPKFGGKGMYGINVHNEVISNREKVSGITIHCIDEEYDRGEIVFQAICDVSEDDTPATLAEKVKDLEHRYYPVVIEKLLADDNHVQFS